jgi:hypothetical protein
LLIDAIPPFQILREIFMTATPSTALPCPLAATLSGQEIERILIQHQQGSVIDCGAGCKQSQSGYRFQAIEVAQVPFVHELKKTLRLDVRLLEALGEFH